MLLKEIIKAIEAKMPLEFQEDYDNSGLQCGCFNQEINSALIALDISDDVIDEAIQNNCNLIISHHPLIFSPLKKITNNDSIGSILYKAIKNNIAIYAMHTNLDNAKYGLNYFVAKKLGLNSINILLPKANFLKKIVTFCPIEQADIVRKALFNAGGGYIGNYDSCSFNILGQGTFRALEGSKPFKGNVNECFKGEEIRIETIFPAYTETNIVKALLDSHPYEEVAYDIYSLNNKFLKAGSGVYGYLKEEIEIKRFIDLLKHVFKLPYIRHNNFEGEKINKVAICTGSGSFLINNAINCGANAFITADLKYHNFIDSANKILLADCGHFETEIFAKEIIKDVLNKKFPNFVAKLSKKEKNPVKYS